MDMNMEQIEVEVDAAVFMDLTDCPFCNTRIETFGGRHCGFCGNRLLECECGAYERCQCIGSPKDRVVQRCSVCTGALSVAGGGFFCPLCDCSNSL